MKKIFLILSLSVFILCSCLTGNSTKNNEMSNTKYRPIFTTGLNSDQQPLNDLREISINEDKIYVFVYWFNLPKTTYDYNCKIFDASGTMFFDSSAQLVVNTDNYYSTTWYQINKNIDKPGKWRFEIYLNNVKVFEKYLLVK